MKKVIDVKEDSFVYGWVFFFLFYFWDFIVIERIDVVKSLFISYWNIEKYVRDVFLIFFYIVELY